MIDYYKAWVQVIIDNGYNPGVYCSYLSTSQLTNADRHPQAWVYHLGRDL